MMESKSERPAMERVAVNPAGMALPTGAPDTPFYSWVVRKGNIVFLSGMSPYDKDKNLIGRSLGDQTRQALENMRIAMQSVGGSMSDVCSITIYVTEKDLQADVYPQVNPACYEYFPEAPPARHVVGVSSLPRPTEQVMISGTAVLG